MNIIKLNFTLLEICEKSTNITDGNNPSVLSSDTLLVKLNKSLKRKFFDGKKSVSKNVDKPSHNFELLCSPDRGEIKLCHKIIDYVIYLLVKSKLGVGEGAEVG